MFHAITKEIKEGSHLLNLFLFGDDWFIQRQMERRDGLIYMRAKKRTI